MVQNLKCYQFKLWIYLPKVIYQCNCTSCDARERYCNTILCKTIYFIEWWLYWKGHFIFKASSICVFAISMKFMIIMHINGVKFVMKTQIFINRKLVTCFLAVRHSSSCYCILNICIYVYKYSLTIMSSSSLVMVISLEFSIHSICYSLFAVICVALPLIMNIHRWYSFVICIIKFWDQDCLLLLRCL